jgi:hypothetical protein
MDRRWWRNPNSDEVSQKLKILLLGGCLLPLHLKLLPLKLQLLPLELVLTSWI